VLQVYALKCALHFHAFMMAQQMMSDVAAAANPGIEHQAKALPAAAEPLAVSA